MEGCHQLFAASYGTMLEELEGFQSRAKDGKGANTVSATADAAVDANTHASMDVEASGCLPEPPTKNLCMCLFSGGCHTYNVIRNQ